MLFAPCVANLAKCTLPVLALLAETQGKGVFLPLFVTTLFVPEPQKEHRKIEPHRTIEAPRIQGRVDCRHEHSHMGYNLGVREYYSQWNT